MLVKSKVAPEMRPDQLSCQVGHVVGHVVGLAETARDRRAGRRVGGRVGGWIDERLGVCVAIRADGRRAERLQRRVDGSVGWKAEGKGVEGGCARVSGGGDEGIALCQIP